MAALANEDILFIGTFASFPFFVLVLALPYKTQFKEKHGKFFCTKRPGNVPYLGAVTLTEFNIIPTRNPRMEDLSG